MNNLTVCYITSRAEPKYEWFLDSLRRQGLPQILAVSLKADLPGRCVRPKPTVWQGQYRLTAVDWWAASNARNTGICLCRTDWIAFVDDRCVLLPGWLDSVREAMAGGYIVCGAYEKRRAMTVENGIIRNGGIITGEDCRAVHAGGRPIPAPGQWLFGCAFALPLEWALNVNGFDERMDGLSFEDCIFGMMLANNGYPIRYDPRMKMIEDRTPEELGEPMRRTDKGVSPNDKSHAALHRFGILKRAEHEWDLRAIRESVLGGEPFPVPTGPRWDWYDGQKICEF